MYLSSEATICSYINLSRTGLGTNRRKYEWKLKHLLSNCVKFATLEGFQYGGLVPQHQLFAPLHHISPVLAENKFFVAPTHKLFSDFVLDSGHLLGPNHRFKEESLAHGISFNESFHDVMGLANLEPVETHPKNFRARNHGFQDKLVADALADVI